MENSAQKVTSETNDYPDAMLEIIRNGLPAPASKKRVVIIGAGISGLVAGSLLEQAGHEVTILEGNDRIGGRIFTLRKPFSQGNYIDMGAMRIPSNHLLAQEYIKKFNLPTNAFNNASPNDLFFVNNILTTRAFYEAHPDILEFPLEEWEEGKTASELFLSSVQPFLELYEKSTPEQREQLIKEYSGYSMGEFLKQNPYGRSLSNNAVRMINVVLGIEGFPEFSFADILTDIIYPIFSEETTFVEITGGNDQLPYSFMPQLRNNILLNQKAEKIFQDDSGVRVQVINPYTKQRSTYEADYVITTLPFTVFQFVDVIPYESLSFKKWQAIKELNLLPAVKVGIEFRTKFWERYPYGNLLTDVPLRFMYLPSHDKGEPGPGILLASYSWGQNALLFNSLNRELVIKEVLGTLAEIYGPVVYEEYVRGEVMNWSANPFSAGCFTLFTPGQATDIGDFIKQPEGRIHFSGEHTSTFHGWIEGGIESGIRVASEVNGRVDPPS